MDILVLQIKDLPEQLQLITTTEERDRAVLQNITKLNVLTGKWMKMVDSIGNQCAYTDRMVEEIIESAKALELIYNKPL